MGSGSLYPSFASFHPFLLLTGWLHITVATLRGRAQLKLKALKRSLTQGDYNLDTVKG